MLAASVGLRAVQKHAKNRKVRGRANPTYICYADKGADVAIGPLTRSPGLRLAFIRGPEAIMVELVQA